MCKGSVFSTFYESGSIGAAINRGYSEQHRALCSRNFSIGTTLILGSFTAEQELESF